jgi:methylmalonyl-CoA mutase N-terminal domain/subunit
MTHLADAAPGTAAQDSPRAPGAGAGTAETGARTGSGIPLPIVADASHVRPGLEERLGAPGEFPFTRGVRSHMYRGRPWTVRQLAGFGTGTDTNARYRALLAGGATGVNGVFDYPSLRAFDSDDERAMADVGRGGVAVDVRDDFDDLFAGIALDEVSVSLVSSQPVGAVPHLAMFLRSAERRGFDPGALSGTSQNDFLMETAITIGPGVLPPADSFRLSCDVVEHALAHLPRWNPISVSGYNYREAGADAQLELGLSLAHGQAVARELLGRGLEPGAFLPRITFFFDAHNDFFEEIAKYRAARRMWATWVRDELGVTDPAAQRLRFHVQTSGVTNVARHVHVNIARSMVQALGAVLGGTQSLHVNGFDEAFSVPTEAAALTALRSQLVLLHENGVAKTADPLGGSYLVEYLTDEMEERTQTLVDQIDRQGGIVAATDSGWVHGELARTAFQTQQDIDGGRQRVVGLNVAADGPEEDVEVFVLPPGTLERQRRRLEDARARRDDRETAAALEAVQDACGSGDNVMGPVLAAIDADATVGEVGQAFRTAFGTWEYPLW